MEPNHRKCPIVQIVDDLISLNKASLDKTQSEITSAPAKDREERYATRKQAVTALHISLPTLSDLINKGDIPAYRLGGRVLLKWEDIDNALKKIEAKKYPRAQ